LERLRRGLKRTAAGLGDGIGRIFAAGRIDETALDALEDLLISADLGPALAARLRGEVAKTAKGENAALAVRQALAREIAALLSPVAQELEPSPEHRPFVIVMAGVNGSGKTTSAGKFAKRFRDQGLGVMLAACDTFRAAAMEQLALWAERTGSAIVTGAPKSDAAGLAYRAFEKARAAGADVLIIDTAGRLQNRSDLMAELQKIVRVLKKFDDTAPHAVVLVLDATVGQNAHSQVEIFREMVDVTGLVVTKLDGTAKGGVLVALAERFGLPVYAVGVGEGADDLRAFDASDFARGLMNLPPDGAEGP
jgi:fused signal recognition particle receptor